MHIFLRKASQKMHSINIFTYSTATYANISYANI